MWFLRCLKMALTIAVWLLGDCLLSKELEQTEKKQVLVVK